MDKVLINIFIVFVIYICYWNELRETEMSASCSITGKVRSVLCLNSPNQCENLF
jgi:hypothetical protein